MPMLPFPEEDPVRPPQAARLAPKLRVLADGGVYFGGSSWKYPGWLGSIYSPERYQTRGKVSTKKFEAECLTEYAQTFPTVCGDFAFYQLYPEDYWRQLFDRLPASFLMGLKCPERFTVATWPKHARYGPRAGGPNDEFLDAEAFAALFLGPLAPHADRLGPLILEFGTFNKSTFAGPDDFNASLDPFLAALPKGFMYAVEIRNPEYLTPAYLATLAAHNVAHVLNAWTRMPRIEEQAQLPGIDTADFTVARALLRKGRGYEGAVEMFSPYDHVQEVDEGARDALVILAGRAMKRRKPAFLFVNNRLEGHAPTTIEAVVDRL